MKCQPPTMALRALGVCLLLASCQCGDDEPTPAAPHASKSGKRSGKAEEVEQQPKSVYKKAYDQARKELSVKNAGAHLEALDGLIEREKEMMR